MPASVLAQLAAAMAPRANRAGASWANTLAGMLAAVSAPLVWWLVRRERTRR